MIGKELYNHNFPSTNNKWEDTSHPYQVGGLLPIATVNNDGLMSKGAFMPIKTGITDANTCVTNGLFDIDSNVTGDDAHTPVSGYSFKIVSHGLRNNVFLHIGFSFRRTVFIRVGSMDSSTGLWTWTDWKQIL